jgi:hypothetical protein
MKKVVQFVVVIALVAAIIGAARTSSVWAGALPFADQPVEPNPLLTLQGLGDPSRQFTALPVTQDGLYYLGGVCSLEVDFLKENVRTDADIEVPVEESIKVIYNRPNELSDIYIPGCHFVHYRDNQQVGSVTSEEGKWKVCFGERPGLNLVVYYYPDSDKSVWRSLPTSHVNGFACADAWYTGEYAPANEPVIEPGGPGSGNPPGPGGGIPGSIVAPPTNITITASGTYSVGGICTIIVEYRAPDLTDNVHVQDPIDEDPGDWDTNVPFPDPDWVLNQPGCHVLHARNDEIVKWVQDETQGKWEICFAAIPGKQNKIYYYEADLLNFNSPWVPIEESYTENGKVCAPAQHTAMYTPASR